MNKKIFSNIIILAIFSVFFGKVVYSNSADIILYIYGLLVSFVLTTNYIVTFMAYKDPYLEALKHPERLKNRPLVSCMVAVFNEEKVIEQCIKSLINQTYKNKEVIFVNDCSTDGTAKVLDKYAKKKLIKVIHLKKNVKKKRALAQAMLVAKGEIFAFSDSDSTWAPDAIEKMVAVFNYDPEIGGATGHCRALNGDKNFLTKVQDSWYDGQYAVRKSFESVFGAITCVSGPLAVFRRAAIYNFIPAWENDRFLGQEFMFATDRTLTGFVLGGKVLGKNIKEKYKDSPFIKNEDHALKDWKIVYCKSARSWTVVPDTMKRVLKQQIRWKKSFLRNIFLTGAVYWRKPILPAFFYYTHILLVLSAPVIAFRHLVYIPATGDYMAAVIYLAGILFVGFTFSLAYRIDNPNCNKWIYRPFMSLLSAVVLSWLIIYSALTIKKIVWSRD